MLPTVLNSREGLQVCWQRTGGILRSLKEFFLFVHPPPKKKKKTRLANWNSNTDKFSSSACSWSTRKVTLSRLFAHSHQSRVFPWLNCPPALFWRRTRFSSIPRWKKKRAAILTFWTAGVWLREKKIQKVRTSTFRSTTSLLFFSSLPQRLSPS